MEDTHSFFDWSHEVVLLGAHVRLCHSRMMFARVYQRATQEMVFDAHDRAFGLFKGACGRGIYDNMKTAVKTIFVGKQRLYNRRFCRCVATSHLAPLALAITPSETTQNRNGWIRSKRSTFVSWVRPRTLCRSTIS